MEYSPDRRSTLAECSCAAPADSDGGPNRTSCQIQRLDGGGNLARVYDEADMTRIRMLSQLSYNTMPAHAERTAWNRRLPFSFYTVQQSIHIAYTNLWSITHLSTYTRKIHASDTFKDHHW